MKLPEVDMNKIDKGNISNMSNVLYSLFLIMITAFFLTLAFTSCETEEHKRDVKELERIQEHRKHLDRRMEWIKDSLELYKYA